MGLATYLWALEPWVSADDVLSQCQDEDDSREEAIRPAGKYGGSLLGTSQGEKEEGSAKNEQETGWNRVARIWD